MSMTKQEMVTMIADSIGTTKTQVSAFFDALASLAYREALHGFVIPGLGKLVLVDRKERSGRNPATGAKIVIPAKRVVRFRPAKACKEAILGH